MANNRELLIKIAADSKDAVAALKKIGDSADKTTSVFDKMGTAAKGMLAGLGASTIVDFAQDTLRAASDLGESTNAIRVTFGDAADKVLEFGESAATSAGLAASEFNNLVVPIGSMLQNFGLSADDAASRAIELTQRAADMASVFNVDVSEALGAIQAGLRGEADPLERFGVGLNAAAVEAYALENGLAATKAGIDDNIKVQARLGLLMEQTNQVAGDFTNTSDGLANQQRIAAAEVENLKVTIGEQLQPAVLDMLTAFRELAPIIADNIAEVAGLASELGPLIDAMKWLGLAAGESGEGVDRLTQAGERQVKLQRGGQLGALLALREAFFDYREITSEVEAQQEALLNSTKSLTEKQGTLKQSGKDLDDTNKDLADGVRIVEQETEAYTVTIRDLITAQAEAADPALALINANIRMKEAQDKVNEAVRKYGSNSEEARDAQLDLLAATGDLDGALGTFKQEGGAESIEALRLMAERAGLSRDAIDKLIDEIAELNSTPVKGIRENADGTYSVGTIKAFDTGGVVPGPRGAAQLAVVHGGETILPTHKGPVSLGMVGGSAPSGNQPIVIQLDGQTLMTALVPHFERYASRTGRTVIR